MDYRHDSTAALMAEVADLLGWIEVFADVRSQDDSKTFARVNRGALRTIRDKCRAMLAQMDQLATASPDASSPAVTDTGTRPSPSTVKDGATIGDEG